MTRKVILVTDPGIDGAFAIALALFDPQLDVLALAASAGNVSAEQATRNVHALLAQFDPPKWPRVGDALPVVYDVDATALHGANGLGGVELQCADLHHPHPADKVLVDEVRLYQGEVTVIVLAPATVLARAIDRDPELPRLVKQIVLLGGSVAEPGNAGPVSEFHFYCDPAATRQVLRSGAPITLIPLDIMRKALFSPKEILGLPCGETPVCQLLRKMAPFGIAASEQRYGIEGFHLKDVLGVCAVAVPQAFTYQRRTVDVETRGELTRGMSVFDLRPQRGQANVDLATDVDMKLVRGYVDTVFRAIDRAAG
jgi:inosine-uridine nucleoside N-ribohydrolase